MKDLIERLRKVGADYDFHDNALIFEAADALEAWEKQEPVAWLDARGRTYRTEAFVDYPLQPLYTKPKGK